MKNDIIWSPQDQKTKLNEYIEYLKKNKIYNYKNYNLLHNWSINNKIKFWKSIWKFTKINGIYKEPLIEKKDNFLNSIFFKNSKINFTKNILSKKDKSEAIIFYSEQNIKRRLNWNELIEKTNKISNYYKNKGIKKGDRIAAILPNIPECIISFLGCAKIGAIWSSCSSDFGTSAIIDRFEQITPKILIICDYYYYNNKKINTLKNISIIKNKIKSIKEIIIIPYDQKIKKYNVNFKYKNWIKILESYAEDKKYFNFNFNIPLYILFSSGTTGKPKCIVHGAGGSLIQHKKEHQLHCNIKENDKVLYFTTCGWMMWNWLVSCLASKATIYLYDGSPIYNNKDKLFKIIDKEKITFFGTSAKYLDTLKQNKIKIKKKYKLNNLKTIASTGSPLLHETFLYVYKNIKKNIHLASISGGTDIVSCFVMGNPNLPVNVGEIQCKSLGMDVGIFNQKGIEIRQKKGELVCKSTFPSKPLYFWKDYKNKEYKNAYFNKFKNVWHHGDFAEITINNGYIIYGRSDATLNAKGIRIGTAELYRIVENINNISECIAAEQNYKSGTRIFLFIKLKNNIKFNKTLLNNIKKTIKINLSPKHVPSIITDVRDIPKTKSGKIVELTIKKILNNENISNISSLTNPECLKEYKEKIKEFN